MYDLWPILRSLRKHKLIVFLLALQISLSCAVVTNLAFLIAQRFATLSMPSGVDEESVSTIDVESALESANWVARDKEVLAILRSIPGVTAVAVADTIPLGGSESSAGVCSSLDSYLRGMESHSLVGPGCAQAAVLGGGPGELKALGLKLVSGRDFHNDEYVAANVPSAILSRSMAQKLFPGMDPLGKLLYSGAGVDHPIRIVGLVDHLVRPRPRSDVSREFTIFWPALPDESAVTYVVRSSPEDRQRILGQALESLRARFPNMIIPDSSGKAFGELRASYFRRDRTTAFLLFFAGLSLLFVTAIGISGLARFWVRQRTRQIGVRRALGATRSGIMHFFLMENLIIAGSAIAASFPLAYAINGFLIAKYEVPHLPPSFLAVGALVLIALSALAALGSSIRASLISPMEAARYRG